MDLFSIIVPRFGSDVQFENTLASVLSTRTARTEILVVHDGTYEDPYDLGREVKFVATDRPTKHMATLLNKAVSQASGRFIGILRPGVELTDDWQASVENAFADPVVGSVSLPITRHDRPNKIVTAGVSLGIGQRRRLIGSKKDVTRRAAQRLSPIGPTLWAGFYRRCLLNNILPLDHRLDPVYLDLDIALAMETMGYDCQLMTESVITTDQSSAILSEAALPHGTSAQRSLVRHGLSSGLGLLASSVGHFTSEILRAPLRPTLLNQAFSRFSAFGYRRSDHAFFQQVSTAKIEAEPQQSELTESTARKRAA